MELPSFPRYGGGLRDAVCSVIPRTGDLDQRDLDLRAGSNSEKSYLKVLNSNNDSGHGDQETAQRQTRWELSPVDSENSSPALYQSIAHYTEG